MTWIENKHKLEKEFGFADFKTALEFVNRVGQVAEDMNHHPEIWFTWGKVIIHLTTHSAGGVTQKDWELSRLIDSIY